MSAEEKGTGRRQESIDVFRLRFNRPVDVPVIGMVETLSAGDKARSRVVIAYEPWHRHHRITVSKVETAEDKEGKPKDKVTVVGVICVPEGWCTYEPPPS